jgi:ABC-2 type transport system ATP-binding protein
MTGLGVQARDLTVRYGDTTAVDGVSFTLQPGRIYGLLGRNGSGKSSLMAVLAGFRRPSSGQLLIDGEDPFENARLMGGTCLIRESGDLIATDKVRRVLGFAAAVRPNWDGELAARLLDLFALRTDKPVNSLSRGQRSALGVVLGLAARAPLTMLDEVYLGMDAPTRYAFYDELLADYIAHPRTIILSSHLIDEIERLFEGVLVLHEGRLLIDEEADEIRGRGVSVTGPAAAVDGFIADLTAERGGRALSSQQLGTTKQVAVFGDLDGETRDRAHTLGLDLGPVPLQDLFVHLTDGNLTDGNLTDGHLTNGNLADGQFTNGTRRQETSR